MKTWIEQITTDIAAAEQAELADKKSQQFVVRHTSMDTRLKLIINAMPEAEKVKPRPLSFFVDALAPKYHGKRAHRGEVAAGLRQLDWVRERKWRSEQEGFCALWWPPAATKSQEEK